MLARRSEALHLLQRVRDEAHRFAVTFHRKLRAKRSLMSGFDELPGVGAARRKILMIHFNSFERMKKATVDEIKAVPSIPANVAERIWQFLHAPAVQDTAAESESVELEELSEGDADSSNSLEAGEPPALPGTN
jgi:ERCC4-type nuclease